MELNTQLVEAKKFVRIEAKKFTGLYAILTNFVQSCEPDLFDGITHDYKFVYEPVLIEKSKKKNFDRQQRRLYKLECKKHQKNPTLYRIEHKIYKQRVFPQILKVIIFERDKYKCCICGRHKDKLKKKEHLEVDHIKAWVDGGETTYHNGQTLCSSCNKAKHHAKKFYEVKK